MLNLLQIFLITVYEYAGRYIIFFDMSKRMTKHTMQNTKRRKQLFFHLVCFLLLYSLFSACQSPASDPTPASGIISGKAKYNNSDDHSRILVSLEQTDGLRSLAALSAVRNLERVARNIASFRAGAIAASTQTDSDGSYSFTGVAPGTYTIYAYSPSTKEKAVAINNITVTAGASVFATDLVLTVTGEIKGRVLLDGNEAGNEGFFVCVAGTSYMAITNHDGRFTISDVPAWDDYLILVTKGNWTVFWGSSWSVAGNSITDLGSLTVSSAEIIGNGLHIGEDGNWWIGDYNTGVRAQGPQGEQGGTPYIGADGYWWIGDYNTGVRAQGPKGEDADIPYIGDDGYWYIGDSNTGVKAQGNPGATPYIKDGNWWIGDHDTGIKARGPQGEQGPEGPQGPAGPGSQVGGEPDILAGKLLILQAYGSSSSAAGVSHSFVELYNTTASAIDLNGMFLYYADGTSTNSNGTSGGVIKDVDAEWKMISLSGTIPAGCSFLIMGPKQSTGARLQLADNYGDINSADFRLSNRAFKAVLIRSYNLLTAQNPFDIDGNGAKATGYIDMAGAANNYPDTDMIKGYETAPARCSASEAVRRRNLTDTNDNSADFIATRYASGGLTDAEVDARKPRNSTDGTWEPFEEPPSPESAVNTLLVFQIGAATDGNVSHSFIELYNAGDTAVNLNGYSVQYADGTKVSAGATEDGTWNKIDLTGTIGSHHSFLVLGTKGSMANPALSITDNSGDMNETFVLSNRAVKVVVVSNTTLLTVQNPFDIDGNGTKAAGYADMVGVRNDNTDQILGYETGRAPDFSKQITVRRKSSIDSDNNSVDFETVDFRTSSSLTAEQKEIKRPKNLAYGAWNPVTGVKE
jgi:hypothetical protein